MRTCFKYTNSSCINGSLSIPTNIQVEHIKVNSIGPKTIKKANQ